MRSDEAPGEGHHPPRPGPSPDDQPAAGLGAEQAVRRNDQRWHTLLRSASDVVVLLDAAGVLTWAGPAAERLLGYEADAVVGSNIFDLVHPDDAAPARASLADAAATPDAKVSAELRLAHADGSWRHVAVIATNSLHDPLVGGIIVNVRDVTEERSAQALLTGQLRVLERIAEGAPLDDTLEEVARMAERVVDDTVCAVLTLEDGGGGLRVAAAPDLPPAPRAALDRLAATGPDGEVDDGPAWSVPIRAHDGESLGLVAFFPTGADAGVTQAHREAAELVGRLAAVAIARSRAAEQLAHRATHDALTGLPNRMLFLDRLQLALQRSRRRPSEPAVFFIDLDLFKDVNDRLGHEAGDELLVQLASRLRQAVRPGDTVARFGGDEFAVLCEDVPGELDLTSLAQRLLDAASAPFALARGRATVSASIGIALATVADADANVLLRHADVAMYRVKASGRAGYVIYDPSFRSPPPPPGA